MERNIGECDKTIDLNVDKIEIYAMNVFEKTKDDTVVDDSGINDVNNKENSYINNLTKDRKINKKHNNINSTKGGENKL